ncbi:MAG: glucose-1-phosphate thymidylyltransferase [Clostridia bacterium]|nr:glucose-1-phosphate thymidylyltransferase [Clostridia bacterium]
MKGLILSGGTGSRLRPLTYTSAKQLIPVANKPILFYAIEALKEAGVEDIGIIVGETKEEVRAGVGDGSRWGVKITYIEQEAPLGLAHAVKIAEPFIEEDSFIMFLGDNLVREGVVHFARKFEENMPDSLILLSEVEEPQRFGVAELRDGKIIRLVEKPKIPPSNLALVGVYLFNKNIFKAVNNIKPSWRNELEITDAIQWLVDNGYTVEPHLVIGWWKDTGKPEDMLEANRLILETVETEIKGHVSEDSQIIGRAVVEEGARVINSTIRGPVVIGKGAVITNSYIGPFTSISEGVIITNSEIEFSIVLEDSRIEDIPARVDRSLIGKNVTVRKGDTRPKANSFVLGDNSIISIM